MVRERPGRAPERVEVHTAAGRDGDGRVLSGRVPCETAKIRSRGDPNRGAQARPEDGR
jgi:hypothetical protein